MIKKKANYNRNSFFDVLKTANHDLQLDINEGTLITFGERAPDEKIIDASNKFEITVVEGFPSNAENVSKLFPEWNVNNSLIQDYVNTKEFEEKEYDICWWYHGPEHLSVEESLDIIRKLKKRCKLVLLSMPHGVYEQGEFMNNKLEVHQSAFYEKHFKEFDDVVFNYETPYGDDRTSIDVFIKGELK